MAADDSEWQKLPADEKVQHKSWKARLSGYEECIRLFQTQDSEKSGEFSKYLGLLKKFAVDSNEIAREKALDAVFIYVENASVAGKTANEVSSGLIQKCLNARAKTKERAIDILMMYIEIEKQDTIQEELVKGLENKQPKIVQSCLEILRRALTDFGSKTFPIKPFLKPVIPLLDDRDKSVRDESKQLLIEVYKWIGQTLMPLIQNVKPIQLQELQTEFDKINPATDKPRQTRFLRSQQDLKAKMEQELANSSNLATTTDEPMEVGDNDDGNDEANIDPYDLMEPVNILDKLPKEFYETIESKQWKERKEVAEEVLTLATKKRLLPGDYFELVKALKKIIAKDSNVIVVITAAKCCSELAKGLRKEFYKHSLGVIEVCLDRFREKKTNVVDALRETCDVCYPGTNLDQMSEMMMSVLSHKTPCVRQYTQQFLTKCFAMATTTTLPKKVLKIYMQALIKNMSEADAGVRETAAESIGMLWKNLGEKNVQPHLTDMDELKLNKIKEYSEKAVLLNVKGETRGTTTASTATTKKTGPVIVKPPPSQSETSETKETAKKVVTTKKKPSTAATGKKAGGTQSATTVLTNLNEPYSEQELTIEEAEVKGLDFVNEETLQGLTDSNWKTRLSSVEKLFDKIKSLSDQDIERECQLFLRLITKTPGLKDTHFQVLKARFDIIIHLATKSNKFSQQSLKLCLQDVLDKVSDVKNSQSAKLTLTCLCEACSVPYVLSLILPQINDMKNPKTIEQTLLWISQTIKEFSLVKGIDVKLLIQICKQQIQNSNANVRQATMMLISTLHLHMGKTIRTLFDDEKQTIQTLIDQEIEKNKDEKAPQPSKFYKRQQQQSSSSVTATGVEPGNGDGEEDMENEEIETEEKTDQMESLLPRVDISDRITEDLIKQLNDKNWKERQAALETLKTLITQAKLIKPNLGSDLVDALKLRLNDNNKMLVNLALSICQLLATALGKNGCKVHAKTLTPAIMQPLSDAKPQVRQCSISTLNAWYDECGFLSMFDVESVLELFQKGNPFMLQELCGWLASVLQKSTPSAIGKCAELKQLIQPVYTCLEDRSADVRSKAQELILPLMIHVSYPSMVQAANKLRKIVVALLDKAKEDLPPPEPSKPAAQAKKQTTATRPQTAPSKPQTAAIHGSSEDLTGDNDDRPATAAAVESSTATDAKKDKTKGKTSLTLTKPSQSKTKLLPPAKPTIRLKMSSSTLEKQQALLKMDKRLQTTSENALFERRSSLNNNFIRQQLQPSSYIKKTSSMDLTRTCYSTGGSTSSLSSTNSSVQSTRFLNSQFPMLKSLSNHELLEQQQQLGSVEQPSSLTKTNKSRIPIRIIASASSLTYKPANAGKAASTTAKKKDDDPVGPTLTKSNKEKRIEDEKALKTLKWNFDVPRREFVEQLRGQMEAYFNKALLQQMFHEDFKYHIQALTTLQKACDDYLDEIVSNLDLILRWLTLRFFETNPSVIMKIIEFLQHLFTCLSAKKQYRLLEYEASAFLPYFILKMGDNKDPIRRGVRQVLRLMCDLYPMNKIMQYLLEGIKSKNSRQRAECLEEMNSMVECFGVVSLGQSYIPTLKEVAKQIADRDTMVRNAALTLIGTVYLFSGEIVLKQLGKLSDKDQSMLDERIRRLGKPGSKQATIGNVAALSTETSKRPSPSKDDVSVPTSATDQQPRKDGTTIVRNLCRVQPMISEKKRDTSLTSSRASGFQLTLPEDNMDSLHLPDLSTNELESDFDVPELPPRIVPTTSISVTYLKASQDCRQSIDLVIALIADHDFFNSLSSLAQIDEVLNDVTKYEYLEPHIDKILRMLSMKLRITCQNHLHDPSIHLDDIQRLFRGILSVLHDLFCKQNLAKQASKDTIKELLSCLLPIVSPSPSFTLSSPTTAFASTSTTNGKENALQKLGKHVFTALVTLLQISTF
ncbi:unnamed protein product [Didymodactylos carnosus]|uniref:TOG domain-containing protein n=1 Tax=Didymodactylos carnosus TaxID=1234261 RepID=A0A814KY77_9BILA|nr:unnamed protein product [Didymodactylos carnosus]CAF3825829.1 unnamed protein product [Didymodactylos carnosus]